ncbi:MULTISPECIES: hypothetical protein [unclassified Pseudonocardia]|nr:MULTISPECIES: hypothetical protein [unclassified Pseudonocardia]
MLSTHHVSEGWVRYRRCACGRVSVELVTLDEGLTPHRETVRAAA